MKAGFLTPLRLEWVADGSGQKVVIEPLVYRSEVAQQTFTVPAGFRTDLASVPRLPLAFWLFGAVADEAAVVHDYLYSERLVSRKMADEVLAEAMKATGVTWWRRGPMWLGVRLFGGERWEDAAPVVPDEDIYFG
jgi:hypothetical protein